MTAPLLKTRHLRTGLMREVDWIACVQTRARNLATNLSSPFNATEAVDAYTSTPTLYTHTSRESRFVREASCFMVSCFFISKRAALRNELQAPTVIYINKDTLAHFQKYTAASFWANGCSAAVISQACPSPPISCPARSCNGSAGCTGSPKRVNWSA